MKIEAQGALPLGLFYSLRFANRVRFVIRSQKSRKRARNPRVNIIFAAAAILLLAGCATVPSPSEFIRNLATPPVPESFHATIESPKPPYAVKYDVVIHGAQSLSTKQTVLLAQGKYQSWSWTVGAEPEIASALQIWLHNAQDPLSTGNDSAVSPALDWDAMMSRLYDLDAYLLGEPPLPTVFHILFLPKEEYRFQATLHSATALPITIIRYDLPATSNPGQFEDAQSTAYFWTQFAVQGMQVDAAWKAGIIPKPVKGSNPELKFLATQLCWGSAANVATIAGSSHKWGEDLEGFSPRPQTGLLGGIDKAISRVLPRDSSNSVTNQELAGIWVGIGLEGYLKPLGLSGTYPERGTEINWINANINFCRALTHYTGNIESQPVPSDTDKGEVFFHSGRSPQTMPSGSGP